MTIKYVEAFIIHDLNNKNIIESIWNLFSEEYEYDITNNDTIILKFDDGSIYDIHNIKSNAKINFGPKIDEFNFPSYFTFENIKANFKVPSIENNKYIMNYNCMIKNYNKKYVQTASSNNLIYIYNNKEIYAQSKIKSNKEKPQYIIAYDDSYFDKDNVKFLIKLMLTRFFYNS